MLEMAHSFGWNERRHVSAANGPESQMQFSASRSGPRKDRISRALGFRPSCIRFQMSTPSGSGLGRFGLVERRPDRIS
jgi:hypothetical protein